MGRGPLILSCPATGGKSQPPGHGSRRSVQAGLYPGAIALIHTCHARGCNTLTMGELCLEHERLAEARLRARIGTVFSRVRAPAIALALAAFGAYLGRASGHVGR
jgi:hypothetical protein